MFKLLSPVDDPDAALRALTHGIALAKTQVARHLVIVVSHEAQSDYPRAFSSLSRADFDALVTAENEQALGSAVSLATSTGVPHSIEVFYTEAATAITNRAVSAGCAGILRGTRGLGTVAGLLLGSVATKVVDLATVPITLVK